MSAFPKEIMSVLSKYETSMTNNCHTTCPDLAGGDDYGRVPYDAFENKQL
jgi:hypothetical protein